MEEARLMTNLKHPNIVELLGVCSHLPEPYIVTECMKGGCLLYHLRNNENALLNNVDVLFRMCAQVCSGLAYLESRKLIHRDLAARTCFVGADDVIKVGNFGLCRYVINDLYVGKIEKNIAFKWAAPEVLYRSNFSSKSDVWAFGVLMWEVFSCGRIPYGRMNNQQIIDFLEAGQILEKPRFCLNEVYQLMTQCWTRDIHQRPSFKSLLTYFQPSG
ncbi:Tyrosine-protein kinase Btk29A-like 2 [Homarus americanus]|uniref:Tyrosine-protein kinase Btk29A-like 2 n=2 Tax=Homarus americanus TaxID=6706 RepID=A0A8J5N0G9_HOMAM|nr:Tyrosine-protein kinase Btk29A-like 2 [Homarus americanus]